MPWRKSTVVQQVRDHLQEARPGDRPLVTLGVFAGGSPWWGWEALLSGGAVEDNHYLTLTEEALLVHEITTEHAQPGELRYEIAKCQAPDHIADVRRRILWSSFRFRLPGEAKSTRMNVRRVWRTEMDHFLLLLRTGRPQ
jgi:hypothetical protein